MSVESTGYRGFSMRRRSAWLTIWPVARTSLVLVLRRKVFWVLLGLALLDFLFLFAMIYLKAQGSVGNPQLAGFIDRFLSQASGDGETYRKFMFTQGTITMILLAFAGSMLVGNDHRQGGLTFYLSRRTSRIHYVLGKLLAIGILVSLTTTIPALVLYFEYGTLMDTENYFVDNSRIFFGIVGYGLTMAIVLSLVLFAMGSWIQKTVPLVMSWVCLFLLVPTLGRLLRHVYDDRSWLLLSIWYDIRLVGMRCFGDMRERDARLLAAASVILVVVCVAAALLSIPRVRAVKVVQ